jgi:hypothetical protein
MDPAINRFNTVLTQDHGYTLHGLSGWQVRGHGLAQAARWPAPSAGP